MSGKSITLPVADLERLSERCWTATSKLESQVVRNPDLPAGYRGFVSESFESLRWLGDQMRADATTGTVCDAFIGWARDAVDEWDGVSTAELIELVRAKFGQTVHQFYGRVPDSDTMRELANLREMHAANIEDVRTTLTQLDGLAGLWGDEGVFRRCRDRLRAIPGVQS